jgi:hypothetical protein
MIIYIDENISYHIAHALNALQIPRNSSLSEPIEIKATVDVFGRGAKDEDWLPQAGAEGACVITQDINIHRIRHQRDLCEIHQLGMFFLKPPSKSGFSYWDLVMIILKHWPEMEQKALREKRAFFYRVTAKGGKLEQV